MLAGAVSISEVNLLIIVSAHVSLGHQQVHDRHTPGIKLVTCVLKFLYQWVDMFLSTRGHHQKCPPISNVKYDIPANMSYAEWSSAYYAASPTVWQHDIQSRISAKWERGKQYGQHTRHINSLVLWRPGPRFNTNMLCYQFRKSHCGDNTVVRSSYLDYGISYIDKIASLHWISSLDGILKMPFSILFYLFYCSSFDNVLRWITRDVTDDKSTLALVMA